MQGKTNEAAAQYQRILRDFSDQTTLATLSRQNLTGMGVATPAHTVDRLIAISTRNPADANADAVRQKQKQLLEEEIKVVEQELHLQETRVKTGLLAPEATLSTQQKLLDLQRQLAALEGDQAVSPSIAATDEEAREIVRIKQMLQNSPDLINAPTENGFETTLNEAAASGWLGATKLLLDNGAPINPEPTPLMTSLNAAARAGNKAMVDFLLSKGANVSAQNGVNGYTPLHYTADHGYKAVAETLLAHGADVDVRDHDGNQPLHVAAGKGYTTLAEVLLAHKADVNAPGKGGETALFRAIQMNRVEMVQFLLSNKASVNVKSESGETPLLSAAGKHDINIAIVKALLDSGAGAEATWTRSVSMDQNSLVTRTVTPLIAAISGWNAPVATLLLQHSANPNMTDDTGETPLDYAIMHKNTNIIGELILHRADVNAPDKQGDPPLAYASRLGDDGKKIKQMLIEAGANEDYQRRGAIFITQKGTGSIGHKVFSKGPNSVNRYTLLELIASTYGGQPGRHLGIPPRFGMGSSAIAFPDFAHVTINRLKADGSKEDIAIDLNEILKSGDCSKNLWLEWGDIVLIPQLDHNVSEGWHGLSQSERDTLGKCLLRKVKVVVKGQTTQFALLPSIVRWSSYTANGPNGDTWFQHDLSGISPSPAAH